MTVTDREYERQWHLDKKVPIALIATLAAQTIAIVWWAANLSTRVDALERQYLATVPRMESVIRLETKVDGLTSGLSERRCCAGASRGLNCARADDGRQRLGECTQAAIGSVSSVDIMLRYPNKAARWSSSFFARCPRTLSSIIKEHSMQMP